MALIFRQIRAEGGCNGFIIGDTTTARACIIDPRADQEDLYEEFLASRKLQPEFVIDSHTHADHFSGSHLVAANLGARIAMGKATNSARADLKLTNGQLIELSSDLSIETLETPGHTPDSISLVAKGSWGKIVFTGDTLFIGGSGRTDFPGADAGAQYDSIHGKLGALEDKTWVMPGHDYSDLLFSTIGHEKKTNPHWLIKSRDEFVKVKEQDALEAPGTLLNVVNFNLNAKPRNAPRAGAMTMCASACIRPTTPLSRKSAAEFRDLLEQSRGKAVLFLDVREPEEFSRGHIEGMDNLPLGDLVMRWRDLESADAVVLACDQGVRSRIAGETLMRLGLQNVIDLNGGFIAWVGAGFPVRK